jgi:HK97 family phage major capsid protein
MEMIKNRTGGFNCLGDFLVAARKFCTGERQDSRILDLVVKTMTEGTDSAGGVLVPEQWASDIIASAIEDGFVLPRAQVYENLKSDTFNIPRIVDTDRSSSIGGVKFYPLEEIADKAELVADPTLGNLKLSMHEAVACFWASNQLEDDVPNFEKFAKLAFGRALTCYENWACVWANGVNKPLGIMSSGATILVTRAANNLINIPDLGGIASRLMPASWKNAILLINQDVLAQWIEMQAVAANSASGIDLSQMLFLGKPIIVTEICSALGTSGDIILADFSQYVIGIREMVISASREVPNYWQANKTFWKMWIRADGQPNLEQPITPYYGSQTVSPFVALTTNS